MRKKTSSDLGSDKRGVIQDTGTILVFALLLGMSFIIIYAMFSQVNTAFQDGGAAVSEGASRFQSFKDKFVPIFDVGFFTLLIGLVIAGVIGLFIIDSHPVLFIASSIGLVIILIIAATVGNAFSDFANSPGIVQYTNEFTFIPLVMGNIFELLLIIGGIFSVALYAKIKR